MRKTYGYLLHRIKQEMQDRLDASYRYWKRADEETEDISKREACRRLSLECRAIADALYLIAHEEGMTMKEYEKMVETARTKTYLE